MSDPTLLVTLTATANTVLAEHLPLEGQLLISEFGRDGLILHAAFCIATPDGSLSAPVICPQPEFTYHPTHAAALWRRIQDAAPPLAYSQPVRPRDALMAQNRGAHHLAPRPPDDALPGPDERARQRGLGPRD